MADEQPTAALDAIAAMRARPRSVLVVRGFGTLVAGAVLFLLMLLVAPSVAPEHIVDRPSGAPAATAPPTTVATP